MPHILISVVILGWYASANIIEIHLFQQIKLLLLVMSETSKNYKKNLLNSTNKQKNVIKLYANIFIYELILFYSLIFLLLFFFYLDEIIVH